MMYLNKAIAVPDFWANRFALALLRKCPVNTTFSLRLCCTISILSDGKSGVDGLSAFVVKADVKIASFLPSNRNI